MLGAIVYIVFRNYSDYSPLVRMRSPVRIWVAAPTFEVQNFGSGLFCGFCKQRNQRCSGGSLSRTSSDGGYFHQGGEVRVSVRRVSRIVVIPTRSSRLIWFPEPFQLPKLVPFVGAEPEAPSCRQTENGTRICLACIRTMPGRGCMITHF